LYGLEQAPNAWYERLKSFLLAKGFKLGSVEKTLFLLNFFLGLQIKEAQDGTCVHQGKYTKDALKKFDMGEAKPLSTPMSTMIALDGDEDGEPVDQNE
jgi:hypothetical protein